MGAREEIEGSLTVGAVLALPVLQLASPRVLAGREALGREVRWVRALAGEAADPSTTPSRGDLVLVSAEALADPGLLGRIDELGASGVLVSGWTEAGRDGRAQPIDPAAPVPVIALGRPVGLADLSYALHEHLLARRVASFETQDAGEDRFTAVVLAGGDALAVLAELARAIRNPVVLEDERGEPVELAAHGTGRELVLTAWRQHTTGDAPGIDPATAGVAAPLPGSRRGRLVALALDGALRAADEHAVRRAAAAVALAMRTPEAAGRLRARARSGLLDALIRNELGDDDAADWAAALGIARTDTRLVPAAVARRPGTGESAETQGWGDVLAARPVSPTDGDAVLVAEGEAGALLAVVAIAPGSAADPGSTTVDDLGGVVLRLLEPHGVRPDQVVVAVGRPVDAWGDAGVSLPRLARVARESADAGGGWVVDARRTSVDALLAGIAGDPELRGYVRETLGPLLDERDARATELLRTLEIHLACGGRKSEAARALHLERGSLYGRLERIEAILGVRLDDARAALGLHLAIRALRALEASGSRPRPLS